jgi:signal transduction histidine kinase
LLRIAARVVQILESSVRQLTSDSRSRLDPRGHGLLVAILYVVVHVVLAWVSYVRPQFGLGITPWSPQAGVALAFLLLCGPRWFPVVALASLLSELWIRGAPAGVLLGLASSLWVGFSHGMTAALLQRLGLARGWSSSMRVAKFVAVVSASTLIIALVYVGIFVLAGQFAESDAISAIARYWIRDLNGVLCLTPLLVQAPRWREAVDAVKAHRGEAALQLAILVVAVCVTFMLPVTEQLRFFYLLFVPIIWIALRWSWPGAMLAVLVVQFGLVIAAEVRIPTTRYVDIQFLLLTLSLTGLMLGAVVAERAKMFQQVVRDAAERRLADEQIRERDAALARAMRFAVAGELASALAHELNQPITALVSYLRASEILATQSVSNDDRLQGTLGKAAREAIRASEVLRRLRDFYQGGVSKYESVDLTALADGVANAFQERLRRHDVVFKLESSVPVPAIQCDRTQLEIVLHNLLANALDAVLNRPPAERTIVLSLAAVDSTIVFKVEDSGRGIPVTVGEQLFEPFVTSKADGMGLGLAISRSLIRSRGGELSFAVSSALGGAAFTIRLPIELPADLVQS